MGIEWNKNYNEQQIKVLLEEVQKISLSPLTLGINSVICSALKFNDEIFREKAEELVITAINNIGRRNINRNNILVELDKLQGEYIRKAKKNYHIATSISLATQDNINSIKCDNVKFDFYKTFPKKYKRQAYLNDKKHIINSVLQNPNIPNNYSPIIIKVRARTGVEAGKIALDYLDFIIGIWNFALNFPKGPTMHFKEIKQNPINTVLKGPIHTIHKQNGDIDNEDLFFYEDDYYGPIQPTYINSRKFQEIKNTEMRIRRRLSINKKWGLKIRDSLIRYSRALENYNYSYCFLQLWNILEFLTRAEEIGNHTITVKKTGNLFHKDEAEIQRALIDFLRITRNSLVHSSQFQSGVKKMDITHQLKFYVEELIRYHYAAIKIFDNFNQALNYLDLPYDEKEIKSRLKVLKVFSKNRL